MASRPPLSPDSAVVLSALARVPIMESLACGLDGKRLLLTGSTGFFGKWLLALLHELLQQGTNIQVTAVSRDPMHFLSTHPQYRHCKWLHWLTCDVRALDDLDGNVDLVLHTATDTSQAAHAHPLELFDTILHGTRRVLDIAVRHGAQRILLTGSGAQYGILPNHGPVAESSPLACDSTASSNAYAEAKRAQETLAAAHAQQSGIVPILTRCFAFAGPGLPLDAHFAIGNFVRDALHADTITLHSTGEAMRSYLHGADLAAWLLFLLLHGKAGEAYNVGSNEALSIAGLAHRVLARLAPHKCVAILGQPGGKGAYYVPDISKAQTLGLDVWSTLDMAIDDMGHWAASH